MHRGSLASLVKLVAVEKNVDSLLAKVASDASLMEEARRLYKETSGPSGLEGGNGKLFELCRHYQILPVYFENRLWLIIHILNLAPVDGQYYELLEVEPGADQKEIKQAFRRLCRRWHPDVNPDDPTSSDQFLKIRHAYEVLTGAPARAAHRRRPSVGFEEEFSGEGEDVAGNKRRKAPLLYGLAAVCALLIGVILFAAYQETPSEGGSESPKSETEESSHADALNLAMRESNEAVLKSLLSSLEEEPRNAPFRRNPSSLAASGPGAGGKETGEDPSLLLFRSVLLTGPSEPPGGVKFPASAGNAAGSPEEAVLRTELGKRVRGFLDRYSQAYEARDLDSFIRLFEPGALENWKPVSSLIPLYRQNFETADRIKYNIRMEKCEEEPDGVGVDGRFEFAAWSQGRLLTRSAGSIHFNLAADRDDFRVRYLDYQYQRPGEGSSKSGQ